MQLVTSYSFPDAQGSTHSCLKLNTQYIFLVFEAPAGRVLCVCVFVCVVCGVWCVWMESEDQAVIKILL